MIEVLITVFVTAVGLLTVAGLQATSKRIALEAVQRTTAATLALDLAERMRANPAAMLDVTTPYRNADVSTITSSKNCADPALSCSPLELANFDLHQWSLQLQGAAETEGQLRVGGLVAPTGCITIDNGVHMIAIAWRGPTAQPPPAASDTAVAGDDPSRNACGNTSADYDDPASAASDYDLRRIIVVPVFVTDPQAPWKV